MGSTLFLKKNNVRYSDTRVHQDIFFSILAFLYSSKTVVVPEIGYFRFQRPGVSHAAGYHGARQLESFASFVRFMEDLFEANGLDKNSEAYKFCIRRLYTWDRDRMYRAIKEEGTDNAKILASITNIGSSMEAMKLVLHDYAMSRVSGNSNPIMVLPDDRDWRRTSVEPPAEIVCEAYGSADEPWSHIPDLSIVIPSYNSRTYIRDCLDSIYGQDFSNLEIIVIDDASTDGSYDILREIANSNKKIRLYRLKYNCRQGIARNIGIEKANGRYIIFVDADDICLPGFFKDAYNTIENTGADLVCFSSELECEDGYIWRRPFEGDKLLSRSEALSAFWENRIGVEPWAKIYKTCTLKLHECKFPPYIYHQDVPFLFDTLRASQKVAFRLRNVYRRRYSENSSIRPKTANYHQIKSAYLFYSLIDHAADLSSGVINKNDMPFIKWNIENVLLDKIAAYVRATNEVPMAAKDYEILKGNLSFLLSLMRGAAGAILEGETFKGKIEIPFKSVSAWRGEGIEPLANILVLSDSTVTECGITIDSILNQSMGWLSIALAGAPLPMEEELEFAIKDARIKILQWQQNGNAIQDFIRDYCNSPSQFVAFSQSGYFFEPDTFMIASAFMQMDSSIQGVIPYKSLDEENDIPDWLRADYVKISGSEVAEAILKGWIDASDLLGTLWQKDFVYKNQSSIDKRYILPWLMQLCRGADVIALYKVDKATSHELNKSAGFAEAVEMMGILDDAMTDATEIETYLMGGAKSKFLEANLHVLLERVATIPDTGPSDATKIYLSQLSAMHSLIRMLLRTATSNADEFEATLNPALIQPATHLNPISTSPGTGTPQLSVIAYVYNLEESITDVLCSLIERCREGIEIIVIDDSSQIALHQSYRDFCEQVASLHGANVRIYETPCHSGLGASWKLGLEKAKGTYIAFMRLGEELPDSWMDDALKIENSEAAFWGEQTKSRHDSILKLLKNQVGTGVYELHFIKECLKQYNGTAFADIILPLLALRAAKKVDWYKTQLSQDRLFPFDAENEEDGQYLVEGLTAILDLLRDEAESETLISEYAQQIFRPSCAIMARLLNMFGHFPQALDGFISGLCSDNAIFLELLRWLKRADIPG